MRDVALDCNRLAVLALNLVDDLVGRRLVAGIADDDTEAAFGCGNRGCTADAAASASDNNNPVRHNRPRSLHPFAKTPAARPEFSREKAIRGPAPAAPDLPGSP